VEARLRMTVSVERSMALDIDAKALYLPDRQDNLKEVNV
jgi:hypothetical protein